MNDLPKFIRHKMIDTGKHQKDLADVIGISEPSFSGRMAKGLFSYSDLVDLFDALDVTDEEIITLMRKGKGK